MIVKKDYISTKSTGINKIQNIFTYFYLDIHIIE